MAREPADYVGAVDLGSNSFFLLVAKADAGQLVAVDKLRERTAIAAGLRQGGKLKPEAQARAIACLERFRERLDALPGDRIRAVGTKALRDAKNASNFLSRAEEALGHPIEIVSGREEARLIYLGVSKLVGREDKQKLIVDIGGGSTECIVGKRHKPLLLDSLSMGCVVYSERFFEDGFLSEDAFEDAELAAALELETMAQRYRDFGWDLAYGTSGTMQAVGHIMTAEALANADGSITLKGLKRLKKQMIACAHVSQLNLKGLTADRAPVLAGGLAILIALFERLAIKKLLPTPGGLREGIAYDLIGDKRRADLRAQSVEALLQRYQVDAEQARRVEATALRLFDQVSEAWRLPGKARQLLGWAALLHELGQAVAYSGHHKHGAYLIENSDLPGFGREEQRSLAALVRSHRRRFGMDRFEQLRTPRRKLTTRLALLLRTAVALHRARAEDADQGFDVHAGKHALMLQFPDTWLDAHPLTRAALDEVNASPADRRLPTLVLA